MKKDWEGIDFEDCLEKVVYSKKIQRKNFLKEGIFPIVSQESEYINGYWNKADDLFIVKKPIVVFGDHTQVIKYIDFDFVLGADGVKILQPIDKIISRYFYYYMLSVEIRSLGYARHYRLLKEKIVPVPPLLEQQRIVKTLDEAFAAIAKAKENTEKNLQNAREIFQSYLQSVFANPGDGWDEKKLGEVFEIKPPKNEARKLIKNTEFVSFVPMEDLGILSKDFVPMKERTLSEVEGSYTYFGENDVLLAKITPCFENGKLGVARKLKNGIGFGSSEYIVFRSTGKVIPDYLYYFLSRDSLRQIGKKLMTGAVGHKRIPKEFVENLKLPFPTSNTEQQIIVNKLDTLSTEAEKLETVYNKKLTDLEELKKSILEKAFSGELNPPPAEAGFPL